jgi:hypothetical protein
MYTTAYKIPNTDSSDKCHELQQILLFDSFRLLLGDAVDVSAAEQNLAGGDSDDPSVWQQVLERFQRWASSHASLLTISTTRICDGNVWRALEY